jgi:hypothetical protein
LSRGRAALARAAAPFALSISGRTVYRIAMPANPGAKRVHEKKQKKRDQAQKARRIDQVRKRALSVEQQAAQVVQQQELAADAETSPFARGVDYDALDALTEEIDALIQKKRFDEAEKKAGELNRKFPSVTDGLQRIARIDELRGDAGKALQTLYIAQKRADASEDDDEASEEIALEIARLEKLLGT